MLKSNEKSKKYIIKGKYNFWSKIRRPYYCYILTGNIHIYGKFYILWTQL